MSDFFLPTVLPPSFRLYSILPRQISGLEGPLATITEDDLKKLFSPFGEIEFVDLHVDPYTSKCKGVAYIKYNNTAHAREAMLVMNGFRHSMMGDQEIRVGVANDQVGCWDVVLSPGHKLPDPNRQFIPRAAQ